MSRTTQTSEADYLVKGPLPLQTENIHILAAIDGY